MSQPHSAADVIGKAYVDALHRLGAKLLLVPPMPGAHQVSGGATMFWGMAFHKLRVFGLTAYQRVLWLDADVLVLRNLDHLLFYPELTAAFTRNCGNPNAPADMSGGMWVLEPSAGRVRQIMALMHGPNPYGVGVEFSWVFGDMNVLAVLFATKLNSYAAWPHSTDSTIDPKAIAAMKARNSSEYSVPEGFLADRNDSMIVPFQGVDDRHWYVRTPDEFTYADGIATAVKAHHIRGRRWYVYPLQSSCALEGCLVHRCLMSCCSTCPWHQPARSHATLH